MLLPHLFHFSVETEFIDYRFMKDIEVQKQARFCCCCVGYHLRIYAEDKDTVQGYVCVCVCVCVCGQCKLVWMCR